MNKLLAAGLLGLLTAAPVHAGGRLADVQVYDRTSGEFLRVHHHEGRHYVAGTPGHQYELRVRNLTAVRTLAVTSVDGVNVISGQTAAMGQGGYVLDAHDSVNIAGWRKSLDDVATFFFTAHDNSYAARTGRPFDVGVIGVALFPEKRRCCEWLWRGDDADRGERDAGSGAAPSAAPEGLQGQRQEKRLGTGHGHREPAPARHTEFERASSEPAEVISIYYDSRENLVAQGVLPRNRDYAQHRRPRPFPGGFVPDP